MSNTISKSDLISTIAAETDATKVATGEFVDSFIKAITENLSKGNKLQISGLGTFSISARAARTGRNPQTGAEIKIPAKKNAKFKAAKALSEALN